MDLKAVQGTSSSRRLRRDALIYAAAAIWLGALGGGIKVLSEYKSTPGGSASAPDTWPKDSRVPLNRDGWTLLMAAHPHCPCTRASVNQLNVLMEHADRVAAYVLFVKPGGLPEGWERTGTLRRASRIRDTTVLVDTDGAEAARFGALTSGQVLIYDKAGRLRFNGGITGGRAHEGISDGYKRMDTLLAKGAVDTASSKVFGCALFEADKEKGGQL